MKRLQTQGERKFAAQPPWTSSTTFCTTSPGPPVRAAHRRHPWAFNLSA
jgi:hypothetical protein